MNEIEISKSTFMLIGGGIMALIWLIALVRLCSRRDIEIHSKVSWVVALFVLKGFGAIIYFFLGPDKEPKTNKTIIEPGNGEVREKAGEVK